MKSALYSVKIAWLILPPVLLLLTGPLRNLEFGDRIPGDAGDGRLNLYFLENIYLFTVMQSESLWHHTFFYPFHLVMGFSDNLFGASFLYIFPRFFFNEYTSFQIWFLSGYILNYISAYYSLRKINYSAAGAVTGALIFTFSNVYPGSSHAQLHHLFAVPLSFTYLLLFAGKGNPAYLVYSFFFMVWQFYLSIYTGAFLLLLNIVFLISLLIIKSFTKQLSVRLKWNFSLPHTALIIFSVTMLGFLLYPYAVVKYEYNIIRPWEEIRMMLPYAKSYFVMDNSPLAWYLSSRIRGIYQRQEHQLFTGFIPSILIFSGFYIIFRKKNHSAANYYAGLSALTLIILFILTLNLGDSSPWRLLWSLPLFSAIRAVSRIILIMLFPASIIAAFALETVGSRYAGNSLIPGRYLILIILILLSTELSLNIPVSSDIQEWETRLKNKEKTAAESGITHGTAEKDIIFFSQREGPAYAEELDSMWYSKKHNFRTMNGYSGAAPPYYSLFYGDNCDEIRARIVSYLNFKGRDYSQKEYESLLNRLILPGFQNCSYNELNRMPARELSDFIVSLKKRNNSELISSYSLNYKFIKKIKYDNVYLVYIEIENRGNQDIHFQSLAGLPLQITWKFTDMRGESPFGYVFRLDLPFDIPENEKLRIVVPVIEQMVINGGSLRITLLESASFPLHDLGIPPLIVSWEDWNR